MEMLNPPGWPRPKGYSNALRVPAGRDLLFTAGLVGWDEHEVLADGFVAQFERALENVLAVVRAAALHRLGRKAEAERQLTPGLAGAPEILQRARRATYRILRATYRILRAHSAAVDRACRT